MILIIFLISIFTFMLVSLIPGDPVYAMLGQEVSQEEYQRVFHELKLDQPIISRYFSWLSGAVQGDWGQSTQFHKSTLEIINKLIQIKLFLKIS